MFVCIFVHVYQVFRICIVFDVYRWHKPSPAESSASTRLCCCGCSVSVAQNAVKMPRDRPPERVEGRKQARKCRKHEKSLLRGPKCPKSPFWAPKRPKTGQNRRLSDTKMAISSARRKIGRAPGAQNDRRIQRNKKGRRSVSPILENSVRSNAGHLGPLKSA